MKKRIILISTILLLFITCYALGYPFWDTLKSYVFMYGYDKYVVYNSPLHKKEIDFYIPNGLSTSKKDWYPLILHHDGSDAFSDYTGKNISLTILYSFGAFDLLKGSSNFYNPKSPYYGAFYGGYVIFDEEGIYGFDEYGNSNLSEIEKVPMFDQTHLVLPSIGCPKEKIIFKTRIDQVNLNEKYMGMNGWTKIDATIRTNAPIHKYSHEKFTGYIQYGKPAKEYDAGENYPEVSLKGRIYVKYIKELKGTFFLYVMAQDEKTIDMTDREILSKSHISY